MTPLKCLLGLPSLKRSNQAHWITQLRTAAAKRSRLHPLDILGAEFLWLEIELYLFNRAFAILG
jgi:hypothetical protein